MVSNLCSLVPRKLPPVGRVIRLIDRELVHRRLPEMLSEPGRTEIVLALRNPLGQQPSIIIFDEPTRGVDVGTIPHIHSEIRRLADEGKAVVVISSYLPEILAVSDRILVARTGRIVAEFDAAVATQDKILYAAIH